MQGQVFLNAVSTARRHIFVFDDAPFTTGHALYDHCGLIPVLEFNKEMLSCVDTFIITAYLHEKVIAQKLLREGFTGRILSISPTPPPCSEIKDIEWLFW